jgi:hypothetical protein
MVRRRAPLCYAFDRLGNPVADGTVINFISEGAGIQPACVYGVGVLAA